VAYELFNGQVSAMELTMAAPIGHVRIQSGEYFPSPEQEKERGFKASMFADVVGPSFLTKTTPSTRRRLLEEKGLSVPEDIIAATRHLPQFSGSVLGEAAVKTATAQPPKSAADILKKMAFKGEEDIQAIADAKCSSSGRHSKPSDNPA